MATSPVTTPQQPQPAPPKDPRREALELLRAERAAGRDVHTVEIRHAS
jgi:hypothetical protein